MNSLSVLFVFLTCASVFGFANVLHHRGQRSLGVPSSLSNIRLSDNEIRIDPSAEELPEIIRRKKSTKKEKMTLEDLKKSDMEEEITNNNKIDNQSSKNLDERSSRTTLQEVHGVDKNESEATATKNNKDNDRTRRQHMIITNPSSNGAGDTMLIMPRSNGQQSFYGTPYRSNPRTHGLGLWADQGIGIGLGGGISKFPGYQALPSIATAHESSVIAPTTYTASAITALPIASKFPVTGHLPLHTQPAHHVTSYATVVPQHIQPTYSCLCPCNQHSYQGYQGYQGYPNSYSSQYGGIGVPQISGLGGAGIGVAKSVSNLDDEYLRSPYIFQGPKFGFQPASARAADHFSDGHQHTPECSMESLSSLNLDKNAMESLMAHEENKLKKIEECAKNNNLNSQEYNILANIVNSELDLLKSEVKSMQRMQQQQQKLQQQKSSK